MLLLIVGIGYGEWVKELEDDIQYKRDQDLMYIKYSYDVQEVKKHLTSVQFKQNPNQVLLLNE